MALGSQRAATQACSRVGLPLPISLLVNACGCSTGPPLRFLGATVLLNSRISALMALAAAASIIAFSDCLRPRVLRTLIAAAVILTLFVLASYSRDANFYDRYGIRTAPRRSPSRMLMRISPRPPR